MESSIPWRSGPLREAGSREPQIGCVEAPEDELDHTGPKLAGLRFQFISETGHSPPKGAARRLIRSQVRRDVKQNRKQNSLSKQVPRLLHPHSESNKTKESSNSATLGLLSHLILTNANTSLNRGLASNRIDPFNTLPVDKRGNSHYLIGQYYTTFQPTNHPYSPVRPAFRKEEFLSFAVSDCAILHATLGHVAMTLCDLAGIKSNPDLVYHVGQAITLVNKRIANRSHKAITKETIFAVACLTSLELRSSPIARVKIHLDGLEALVKSKGGIRALVSHPLTLRFTCWVDNLCSIAMNSKPRFELVSPAPDPEDLEPCTLLGERYKTKLSNLAGIQDLSQETIEVYRILRYLIAEKEMVLGSQKMGTEAEFESLRSYTDQLMHRLIALVQHKIPKSNQNAVIYSLFGNAALAHIVMFTRNATPRVGVPILMSTRIRTSLDIINLRSFQIAYPEMMLWIIMMGGLASIGTPDQGWFIKLLEESCRAAGIAGTAELALSLTEFLWSEFYLGPIFEDFWDDVFLAQAVEIENDISEGGYEL
ncbi:hypothetical protein BKA61DRAFT_736866 [Leptodontidium sp. MPI-SDFR-AT-0119]|nr:hypothetical protein BKA61DRAFT_736866 [Leptodontidium sp. MPI-SDFR-AT-0119]